MLSTLRSLLRGDYPECTSDASLTPRNAADRFLNPNRERRRHEEKAKQTSQELNKRTVTSPSGDLYFVVTEPDDLKRAAEICLNYDKALRRAMLERKIVGENSMGT
jgi:hypothetical protein